MAVNVLRRFRCEIFFRCTSSLPIEGYGMRAEVVRYLLMAAFHGCPYKVTVSKNK